MPSPLPPPLTWVRIPFIATCVVSVVLVLDLAANVDGTVRGLLRVVVIAAAVVVAGVLYQRWSTVPERTVPHHAMAALAMLGGALVASSAFSTGAGVFGTTLTALLGLAALWTSLLAARASVATPTGADR